MKKMISSPYELNELLELNFGGRLVTDPLSVMAGSVAGTLDSRAFVITFAAGEFLLISTAADAREILDELTPLLTKAMQGQNPICSYDLHGHGVDKPTIEWDIKDPEGRIKEIVNGRAFPGESKVLNLKLYGSREIKSYLESEEEKAERIKSARIYGIDKGCISDVEAVSKLSEVDLFLTIDALGGHIWSCKHQMSHDRIPQIDLTEEQYALEYLVYQTTRFGVELEEPAIDKHITPTPSYKAWYEFYSNHFKNVLTKEEFNAFELAKKQGKDTSEFMPTGNWRDSLGGSRKRTLKD